MAVEALDGGLERGSDNPAATLTWHFGIQPGHYLVRLKGDLDAATAPRLADLLHDLLVFRRVPHVVLDLAEVEFLDAPGARVFSHACSTGAVQLRDAAPQVRRVLEILGIPHTTGPRHTTGARRTRRRPAPR